MNNMRNKAEEWHISIRKSQREEGVRQNREEMLEHLITKVPYSQECLMEETNYDRFISKLTDYVNFAINPKQSLEMSSALIDKIISYFEISCQNPYQKLELIEIIHKICYIPDYKFLMKMWNRMGESTVELLEDERIAFKFISIIGNGIINLCYAPANLNVYLREIFKHTMYEENAIKSNLIWLLGIIAVYCNHDVPLSFENVQNTNQFLRHFTTTSLQEKSLILLHLYEKYQFIDLESLREFSYNVLRSETNNFYLYRHIFSIYSKVVCSESNASQHHSQCYQLLMQYFTAISKQNQLDPSDEKSFVEAVMCLYQLNNSDPEALTEQCAHVLSKVLNLLPESMSALGHRLSQIMDEGMRNLEVNDLLRSSPSVQRNKNRNTGGRKGSK